MKTRITALAISLLILSTGSGWAKLDAEEQAKVNALVQTLNLDAAQTAQVTRERETSKQQLLKLEKQWQTLHDQLRREVRKRVTDEAEVDRITREIGKVRGEIVALRTHSLIFLKSILNDAQLEKIEQTEPAAAPVDQD